MIVRGAQAEAELETVADMQMAAFAPTGMVLESRPRRLERLRERFALHQTRLVEYEGQIVAVLNVVDRQMRVGTATVRFGGLSGVVTLPEHRRKGYARVLLEDTLDYMRRQGYSLSVLNGIPDFYGRFGYATVMPFISRVCVPAAHAVTLKPPADLIVRAYEPDRDQLALMALYEAASAIRTGSVVRDETTWHWQDRTLAEKTHVAIDAKGAVRGYVRLSRDEKIVHVVDGAVEDAAASVALSHALGNLARERFVGEITLSLPPDAPWTRRILHDCGGEVRLQYPRQGGWMGRVLDVPRLCAQLIPELTRRLQASPHRGWPGCLRLETDIGEATLLFADGQIAVAPCAVGQPMVCRLPQTALVRLVFGASPVGELLSGDAVDIPEVAMPLLETLFPPGHAFIAEPDGF